MLNSSHPNSSFCSFFSLLSLTLLLIHFEPSKKVLQVAEALNNGLALKPPMGWLAWQRYVCETDCTRYPGQCVDYNLFEEMAIRMVEDGFKQVGYEYVNIDDCWSARQRENSTQILLPDPVRFPGPNSIGRLADKVHELGLKLGIYGDCGTSTCQLYPGQLKYRGNLNGNYYELDANTFAQWGVDSFKFDGCALEAKLAHQLCPPMQDALNATGRPILFSCSWPAYELEINLTTNWAQVVERCNLWRVYGDMEDSWSSILSTMDWFIKNQELIVRYHGPGHWFDPDQLIIGDFGLSEDEERTQFAIWSIWSAPLYMGNDLRALSEESSKILRNKWLIAVNQDPMGIFGMVVEQRSSLQVFAKPLDPVKNGCPSSYAIVYFNRRQLGTTKLFSFALKNLLSRLHQLLAPVSIEWASWSLCGNRTLAYSVHDLYDNFKEIISHIQLDTGNLELYVNPSGVRAVQLMEVQ